MRTTGHLMRTTGHLMRTARDLMRAARRDVSTREQTRVTDALVLVRPATLIRQHREDFRRYWWHRSRPREWERPSHESQVRLSVIFLADRNTGEGHHRLRTRMSSWVKSGPSRNRPLRGGHRRDHHGAIRRLLETLLRLGERERLRSQRLHVELTGLDQSDQSRNFLP